MIGGQSCRQFVSSRRPGSSNFGGSSSALSDAIGLNLAIAINLREVDFARFVVFRWNRKGLTDESEADFVRSSLPIQLVDS